MGTPMAITEKRFISTIDKTKSHWIRPCLTVRMYTVLYRDWVLGNSMFVVLLFMLIIMFCH